jgi:hypothetical protein
MASRLLRRSQALCLMARALGLRNTYVQRTMSSREYLDLMPPHHYLASLECPRTFTRNPVG